MDRFYNLSNFRKIKINESIYNILGYGEFKSDSGELWKKYRVIDHKSDTYWLHVYGDSNKEYCKIYARIVPLSGDPVKTIYSERNFRLVEQGSAKVVKVMGIKDLNLFDLVEFRDFETSSGDGELLSYEKWNEQFSFEYGKGRYVNKNDIVFIEGKHIRQQFVQISSSINLYWEINLGKFLKIGDREYCVYGITAFEDKNKNWREYVLKSGKSRYWLYLERDSENRYLAFLGKNIPIPDDDIGDTKLKYKGRDLELTNADSVVITEFEGEGDDSNVGYIFYTYQSINGDCAMIARQSSRNRSCSFGNVFSVEDIVFTNKEDKDIAVHKSKKRAVIFAAAIILTLLYMAQSIFFQNRSISYFIKKNASFSLGASEKEYEYYETSLPKIETNYVISAVIGDKLKNAWPVESGTDADTAYLTEKEIIVVYYGIDNKSCVFVSKINDFFGITKNLPNAANAALRQNILATYPEKI
jgi:hypothetical protein